MRALTDGTALGSPAGLSVTTDEALQEILSDLEGWRASLPDELQFRGPKTPRNAGTSISLPCRAVASCRRHLLPGRGPATTSVTYDGPL